MMADEQLILDIGGHAGNYMFEVRVAFPGELCFIADLDLPINRFDSPEGAYHSMKEWVLFRGLNKEKMSKKENESFERMAITPHFSDQGSDYLFIVHKELPVLLDHCS